VQGGTAIRNFAVDCADVVWHGAGRNHPRLIDFGGIKMRCRSMVTISPELTVNTGFSAALKCPTCTVCGLGISEYSAPDAEGTTGAKRSKLKNKRALKLYIASSLHRWHLPS
jgi:hypothetical protein